MRTRFLLTLLIPALTACNVTKRLEKQSDAAFLKNGLEARTFRQPDGVRYTWSSTGLSRSEKPKLLLVHGITSSSVMWTVNLPTLSARFDLIVPDPIGHGRTTVPWSGNSVEAQVEHLAAILDSLQVSEPVFVVGNSYGGAIAANFAERHPDRARGLVIYDGPASDYTRAMADSVARSVGAADIAALFTPMNECR